MNIINMTNAYKKFFIATEEATQSMKELSALLQSYKNRYNPIVW